MNISISTEGLERANKALAHINGGFPRAVSATVNRVLEGMRTDAVNETKARYYAKPGDIRKTITLKTTKSASNFQGAMISRGTRKSLADYKLTPRTPKKGMKGLEGAVKNEGLKQIKSGFLLKQKGSYKPYIRTSSGKWGIEPLISPAIPQILKNEETVKIIEEKAAERFEKRLNHEVMRMLKLLP